MEQDSKMKKILYNQVTFVIAVGSTVLWLINYVNNPVIAANEEINSVKTSIALIQKDINNIQAIQNTYDSDQKRRDEAMIQMQTDIAVIKSLLQQEED